MLFRHFIASSDKSPTSDIFLEIDQIDNKFKYDNSLM